MHPVEHVKSLILQVEAEEDVAADATLVVHCRGAASSWNVVTSENWAPTIRVPRPDQATEFRVVVGEQVGHAVADAGDAVVTVYLRGTAQLAGIVVDRSGSPVPHASIYVREDGDGVLTGGARVDQLTPAAISNVDGRFRVGGLHDGRDLLLRASAGWSWASTDVRARPGDESVIIEVARYEVAAFRAVDESGGSVPLVLSNGRLGFSFDRQLMQSCLFVDPISAPPGELRQLGRELEQLGARAVAFPERVVDNELAIEVDVPGFLPAARGVPVVGPLEELEVTDIVLQSDGTPVVDLRVRFRVGPEGPPSTPWTSAGRLNLIGESENVFVTVPSFDDELLISGLRPEPYQWSLRVGVGLESLPDTAGAPAPRIDLSVDRVLEIDVPPRAQIACLLVRVAEGGESLYDGLTRIHVAPLDALRHSDNGAWLSRYRTATFAGAPYVLHGLEAGAWVISPFGDTGLSDDEYQIVELSSTGRAEIRFSGQFSLQ
ncbi:hypothetical protein Pla86_24420 [Planctomycetes bacterium Pla86]|uniref:Carboxypeptidase regulatory-like domain-containing protein n=2 Tax=Engelhardtia mirabilis TaxID=2528011 RepID=A0A518BK60_9BACT|nr:hypothetical protein Pla133_24430 [Planctomycetes bacterium Pla133]QDV01687.1 hypothetical protein Pla86_24420 [Planctomycetes bacterium Pla86]